MHGSMDNLITFPHGELLFEMLGGEGSGVTKRVFEERGHYLPMEERVEFKKVVAELIDRTEKLQ